MRIYRTAAIGLLLAGPALAQTPPVPGTPTPSGGWTRDGWSDSVPAARDTPRQVDPADMPLLPRPGDRVSDRDAGPITGRPDGGERRGNWDSGRGAGFRYRRGGRLPAAFSGPAYGVSDWAGYGLARPPAGATWVRYYDDAVLIDAEGTVIDAAPDIGWTQPPRPYQDASTTDPVIDRPEPAYTYSVSPGTIITRGPPGQITITTVTTPQTSTTTTVVETVR